MLSPRDFTGEAEWERYHRQTLIEWWDQALVSRARFLVVGAGALGNEILKTLALLGAGRVLVYDMDRIERSNLSRGVLFRDDDVGSAKAQVAVARLRELNPEVIAHARVENIVHRAGLGVFTWADVVISGVDNREARIFVNSACSRTGHSWVDGAIEGLAGVVRVFDPASGPCYECTMNETDRRLVAERRSCALIARDIRERGHVPNTAVAASVVGALQVQEALKVLHGRPALSGEGIHLDGTSAEFHRVRYRRRSECLGHEVLPEVTSLGRGGRDVTVGELLDEAERELGRGAVLEFSRDLVRALRCPECGEGTPGRAVLGEVREKDAACPRCGVHRVVELVCSLGREADCSQTLFDLGLPLFDVIVARRGLDGSRAWLLDGDAAEVLGPLAAAEGGGGIER